MKSLLSQLNNVRSRGMLYCVEILFNRFVPAWVFRYSSGNLYQLDIENLSKNCPSSFNDDDIIFSCLDDPKSDAWHALRAFTRNSIPAESTVNHFGYVIYDASETQQILAGVWVASDEFQEEDLGFAVQLSPQQGWLYCAHVGKHSRGRGIYKRLLCSVAKHSRERGVSQLVCVVQTWNRISRFAHERRSNWIMGWISSFRIGPLAWLTTAGNVMLERRFVSNPSNSPAIIRVEQRPWKAIAHEK